MCWCCCYTGFAGLAGLACLYGLSCLAGLVGLADLASLAGIAGLELHFEASELMHKEVLQEYFTPSTLLLNTNVLMIDSLFVHKVASLEKQILATFNELRNCTSITPLHTTTHTHTHTRTLTHTNTHTYTQTQTHTTQRFFSFCFLNAKKKMSNVSLDAILTTKKTSNVNDSTSPFEFLTADKFVYLDFRKKWTLQLVFKLPDEE